MGLFTYDTTADVLTNFAKFVVKERKSILEHHDFLEAVEEFLQIAPEGTNPEIDWDDAIEKSDALRFDF